MKYLKFSLENQKDCLYENIENTYFSAMIYHRTVVPNLGWGGVS